MKNKYIYVALCAALLLAGCSKEAKEEETTLPTIEVTEATSENVTISDETITTADTAYSCPTVSDITDNTFFVSYTVPGKLDYVFTYDYNGNTLDTMSLHIDIHNGDSLESVMKAIGYPNLLERMKSTGDNTYALENGAPELFGIQPDSPIYSEGVEYGHKTILNMADLLKNTAVLNREE